MLRLASFDIILVVLIQTINGALQGIGKINVPVIAFAIGGICKLIFNILLIPIEKIGIYGAIISNLISHVVSLIICFLMLKTSVKDTFKQKNIKIDKLIKHSKIKTSTKQNRATLREIKE